MLRKRIGIIAILIMAAMMAALLFACGQNGKTDVTDPDNEQQQEEENTVKVRTVAIINGESRSVRSYSLGETVKLKAELSANSVFLCWTSQGVPFSYDKETYYTVTEDAVVKAVYAQGDAVTLETDGGELPQDASYKVVVWEKDGRAQTVTTEGTLYEGYAYALPVPARTQGSTTGSVSYDPNARYEFVGWYAGERKMTDAKGKSLQVYEGGNTTFTAVYQEKPYVFVTLKNDETGDVLLSEKVYKEQGTYKIVVPEQPDRECTGVCSYGEDGEKEILTPKEGFDREFYLSVKNAREGETLLYGALYREAYRMTVLSGTGTGYYEKTEEVPVACTVLTGRDFVGWTVKIDKKVYYLATKAGDKETTCLVAKDGTEAIYLENGERKKHAGDVETIRAWKEENGVSLWREEGVVVLGVLEELGVRISGTNTIVEAEFKRKDYALTYVIDCQVDGQHCLDAAAEAQLESIGFVYFSEDDTYRLTQYYNYNDTVELLKIPAVTHYKFGNWQNAEAGANVPVKMPNTDVTVLGLFTPDTHQIAVSVKNSTQGNVHIGALGDIKRAWYNYGSYVEFYLTAYSGYRLSRWVDMEGKDVTANLTKISEERETEVTYVYRHLVTANETLVVELIPRNYTITYLLTVEYDGEDVTRNPAYFEENGYVDGYWRIVEERDYGTSGTFRPKTIVKDPTDPQVGALPLVYGARNWEVSNWQVYGQGLTIGEDGVFTMPDRDLIVTSTCKARFYTVTLAKKDAGLKKFSVVEINGKAPEEYALPRVDGAYSVPYSSDFSVTVECNLGYSLGSTRAAGRVLVSGDENRYVAAKQAGQSYLYNVGFRLINSGDTTYELYASQIGYSITYYASYDQLHEDDEVSLNNYIRLDDSAAIERNGTTYYLVTAMKNGAGDFATINSEGKAYGAAITEVSVAASPYKYTFSGWTKMKGGEEYLSSTMPDDDVWFYGRFTLNTYTMKMGKSVYRYDGAAGTSINSANVVGTEENGVSLTYDEGDYDEDERHAYFTAYTLRRHIPTGYDFVTWQIFEQGKETAPVAEFTYDPTVTEIQRVETADQKVFKYAIGANDEVIVYLTANCVVTAKYSVMRFTATATIQFGSVSLKTPEADDHSWVNTTLQFDYESNLMVSYNCESYLTRGQKVTKFTFIDEHDEPILDDEGDPVELGTDFHQDTLTYGGGGYYVTTSATAKKFTQNVRIVAVIEDATYYLTYRLYEHAKNASELDTTAYVDITEDADGNPLTVPFKQNKVLADDAEIQELAGDNDMYVTNVMHSGWYNAKTLTTTIAEGTGYRVGGTYRPTFTYNHTAYTEHAVVCGYFVDLFGGGEGEVKVNPIIRSTVSYNQHFAAEYQELTLPSAGADGVAVTTVAEEGFIDCSSLRVVHLPDSIVRIGARAFKGCSSLTTPGLGDIVTTIGEEAYKGCSALGSLYLGKAIQTIGNRAFEDTLALASVTFDSQNGRGAGGLTVGANVFRNTTSSQAADITFTVGADAVLIPSEFFNSNLDVKTGVRLNTVTFVESQTTVSVEGAAFYGSGLQSFVTSDRIGFIGAAAFRNCASLTFVDLTAAAVTELNENLFRGSGVEEVVFSGDIETVGAFAFAGCTSLVSVYYGGTGPENLGEGAFKKENSGSNMSLVRITSVTNKEDVDGDATTHKGITLTALTAVGDKAFAGCPSVESAYIGGAATVLGNELFSGDAGLQQVTYAVIQGIDRQNNTELTFAATGATNVTLTIEEGVVKVPDYAFYGFGVVKTLRIPSTVTSIGGSAFGNMTALTDVEYAVSTTGVSVGSTPFVNAGVNAGYTLTVKPTVVEIGANLFYSAAKLKTVVVEAGEQAEQAQNFAIGSRAFESTGVTSVTIPKRDTVTFGQNAFRNAPLGSVTVSPDAGAVIFAPTTLSDKGNPSGGTFTLTLYEKALTTLPGSLSSGTIRAERIDGNLRVTIMGALRTTSDFDATVLATEEVLVSGASASVTVADKATVYGTFTLINGGTAAMASGARYFRAVAMDKDDFTTKNACSFYSHLRMGAAMTFDEAITVTTANFEIDENLTVETVMTVTSPNVTAAAGVAIRTKTQASLRLSANTVSGATLTAEPDAEIIVGGQRMFYKGDAVVAADLAVSNSYGIRVTAGVAQLIGGQATVSYAVPDGGAVTTRYDYDGTYGIALASGSTFTSIYAADVVFSTYSVATEATVEVKGSSRVRLANFSTNCNGSVDAEAYVAHSAARIYYAALKTMIDTLTAITTEISAMPTVVLEKDIDTSVAYESTATYALNFNGHAMTLTTGLNAKAGNVTLTNPDLTVSGASYAVQSKGSIVVSGGTIESATTALKADGTITLTNASVTTASGVTIQAPSVTATSATITSRDDTAIEARVASVTSCTITGENGVDASGETANVTMDGGSLTASQGYGIEVSGSGSTASITNAASVTARGVALSVAGTDSAVTLTNATITSQTDIGVLVQQARQTLMQINSPIVNMNAQSSVTGVTAGMLLRGTGYYVVNGSLTATSARNVSVSDGYLWYTGALVVIEGDLTETEYAAGTYSISNRIRVAFGGHATNTSGDAVLYAGIREDEASAGDNAAVSIATYGNVTGKIVEVAKAYSTTASTQIFDLNGTSNEIEYDASGSYGFVAKERVPMTELPVLVDRKAAGATISDGCVRYIDKYESLTAALATLTSGDVAWVENAATVSDATMQGTIVLRNTLETKGDVEMASGALVLMNDGKLTVKGNFTYAGGVFATPQSYGSEYEIVKVDTGATFLHTAGASIGIENNQLWTVKGTLTATRSATSFAMTGKMVVDGGTLQVSYGFAPTALNEATGSLTVKNNATLSVASALYVQTATFLDGTYSADVIMARERVSVSGATLTTRAMQTGTLYTDETTTLVIENNIYGSLYGTYPTDVGDVMKYGTSTAGLYGNVTIASGGNASFKNLCETYGQLTIRGTMTMEEVENSTEDCSLVGTAGSRIVVDGGTLVTPRVDLYEQGAAFESYNGTLQTAQNGDITIGVRQYAWAYVQGAATLLSTGNVTFEESDQTGYGKEVQRVVDEFGTDYGAVATFYAESDLTTDATPVEATCSSVGYTPSAAERTITLTTGLKYTIAYERKNLVPITGNHFFRDDENGLTHTCEDCGNTYRHDLNVLNMAHIDEVLRYQGNQIYPMAWYCSGCDYSGNLLVVSDMTVGDFNALNLRRKADENSGETLWVRIDEADSGKTLRELNMESEITMGETTGCYAYGKRYDAVRVKFYGWNESAQEWQEVTGMSPHVVLLPYEDGSSATYYHTSDSGVTENELLMVGVGGNGAGGALIVDGATEGDVRTALSNLGFSFTATFDAGVNASDPLLGRYSVVRYGVENCYLHGGVAFTEADTSITEVYVLVRCNVTASEIIDGNILSDGAIAGTPLVLPGSIVTIAAAQTEILSHTYILLAANKDGDISYKVLRPYMEETHATNLNDLYAGFIRTVDGVPYASFPVELLSDDGYRYDTICYVLYPHTVHNYTHAADGHYCTIGGEYVDHIPHTGYMIDDYVYNATTYSVVYEGCSSAYCDDGEEALYTLQISSLNTSSTTRSTQMSTIRTAVTNANLVVEVGGYKYGVTTKDTSSQRIYAAINTAHTAVSMTGTPVKCLLQVTLTAKDGGPALSGTYYIILTA